VLTTGAFIAVALLALALLAVLFWALRRVRSRLGEEQPPPADGPPFSPHDRFTRRPGAATPRAGSSAAPG
jgi:hypothetical protein